MDDYLVWLPAIETIQRAHAVSAENHYGAVCAYVRSVYTTFKEPELQTICANGPLGKDEEVMTFQIYIYASGPLFSIEELKQ